MNGYCRFFVRHAADFHLFRSFHFTRRYRRSLTFFVMMLSPSPKEKDTNVTPPSLKPASITSNNMPYGLGGWLILPILGLLATLISAINRLITETLPVFTSGDWTYFTSSGSEDYHHLFAPFLIFKLVWNISLIVAPVFLLVLIFKKNKHVRKSMITYLITSLILYFVDFIFITTIPAVAKINPEPTSAVRGALLAAAIWIPYFLKSTRVKNTFVH